MMMEIQGTGVTSLANMVEGEDVTVDTVGEKLVEQFEKIFNCESRDMEDEEKNVFLEEL